MKIFFWVSDGRKSKWAIRNINTSQKTRQRTKTLHDIGRIDEAEVEVDRRAGVEEETEADREIMDRAAVKDPDIIHIMNQEIIRQGPNTTHRMRAQLHLEAQTPQTM